MALSVCCNYDGDDADGEPSDSDVSLSAEERRWSCLSFQIPTKRINGLSVAPGDSSETETAAGRNGEFARSPG
ncbi:hypothetical protein HID58_013730 [Brassica napus]|uniref:Uncharacterized protein n=1 Tax=Brassica napus TaxID=3708 RepID=A0ABQ7XHF6_BRANA|nr:hypothetical protein HID58_013730 [Brassica napus]